MIDGVASLVSIAGGVAKALANPVKPTANGGFAEALDSAARAMTSRLHATEETAVRALAGEAGTRELVDAVMAAERTLQTAIAVRDKAVAAYLEISRMTI